MNTRHQTRWTLTLAAITLCTAAACGTEVASAPTSIVDPGTSTSDSAPDDNPARLDFRDNGRG